MLKKILIVDDDIFVTKVLEKMLSECYQVTICFGGEEAIIHVKNTLYDAIITDLNMPYKSGLDLAKEIKDLQQVIPILIISGENFSGAAGAQYLNAVCGYADEILGKPFTKIELINTLNSIITNRS